MLLQQRMEKRDVSLEQTSMFYEELFEEDAEAAVHASISQATASCLNKKTVAPWCKKDLGDRAKVREEIICTEPVHT